MAVVGSGKVQLVEATQLEAMAKCVTLEKHFMHIGFHTKRSQDQFPMVCI
tara:strand:- start:3851 stop:4000 length:150 start_codon:yes stop_codon:yes gene_type:complete